MAAIKVCVVCAGNICRSPMAEVVFRSRLANAGLADSVVVESAGTGGWHIGEPADPRAQRTLRANGYDGSGHQAQQFQASWFDRFDLVLALDHANLAHLNSLAHDEDTRAKLRMLRSYATRSGTGVKGDLDVPDPYYGGNDGFEHVLRLIEHAADGFVDEMRRRRDTSDVAGPQSGTASP